MAHLSNLSANWPIFLTLWKRCSGRPLIGKSDKQMERRRVKQNFSSKCFLIHAFQHIVFFLMPFPNWRVVSDFLVGVTHNVWHFARSNCFPLLFHSFFPGWHLWFLRLKWLKRFIAYRMLIFLLCLWNAFFQFKFVRHRIIRFQKYSHYF